MKTLPVAEVRKQFSMILREVESGKEIGVSFGKNKKIIAVIISIDEYKKINTRKLGTLRDKGSVEFAKDWELSDEELLRS